MTSLIHNLGLDWKLFLAQVANFAVVLLVLRWAVYQPLIRVLRERKERIEGGLAKATEADRRLAEIDSLRANSLKEAEAEGLSVIREAEKKAAAREAEMLRAATVKEKEIAERAAERAAEIESEGRRKVTAEAADLVKRILVRTVAMSPEAVDEALIKKAAAEETGK